MPTVRNAEKPYSVTDFILKFRTQTEDLKLTIKGKRRAWRLIRSFLKEEGVDPDKHLNGHSEQRSKSMEIISDKILGYATEGYCFILPKLPSQPLPPVTWMKLKQWEEDVLEWCEQCIRKIDEKLLKLISADTKHNQQEAEESIAEGKGERSGDAIYSLGDRRYQSGKAILVVTERQNVVLQSFIDRKALSHSQLLSKTGYEDAPRILGELAKNYDGAFKEFITKPVKKGQGGYRVKIKKLSELRQHPPE